MKPEKKNILCVVGTRPEAIKMAPVILALQQNSQVNVRVLATAQHRQLLDQVLNIFDIQPDIDLDIMSPNQALTALTARLLMKLDQVLQAEKPDAVLAQGDTTTVMTVALACFYYQIPFGHIEAGLRTGDMFSPFPEEMNRVVAGRLAQWHFAPTEQARQNLLQEGIPDANIWLTGNTVIDALKTVTSRTLEIEVNLNEMKRLILVTVHRRENFGVPIQNICSALLKLLERNDDIQILFPVHPNPNIRKIVYEMLDGHPEVVLCSPLDYLPFVAAMQRAFFILSDSGGVQEEAPALGKPVLMLRSETERPEAGVVKLIGHDYETIVAESQRLLDDKLAYQQMAQNISPYGDGRAAERIVSVVIRFANEF